MSAASTSISPPAASSEASDVSYGIGRVALGDIIRRSAQRFGDKIAVYEGDRETSYSQLDADSNRLAHLLASRGLAKGSSVVTLGVNSTAYLTAIFAINKAAMVWVPVNILLLAQDIRFIVEHSEASFAIVDRAIGERAEIAELFADLGVPMLLVSPDASDAFEAALEAMPDYELPVVVHERDLALIMYTSGTTAKPKGVMHCHLAVYLTMLNNIGEWSVTRDDRILMGLPLFHVSCHTMVTVLLTAGGSVVLHRGFDAETHVDDIVKHRVTMLFALPMMYDGMLRAAQARDADLSSLRFAIYAMAPMPRTLLEALIAGFCSNFALASGQTEIYPQTVMFRPEQQLQRFGPYWGESAVINDTAIMDGEGLLLPKGEVGEIVHRGPNVMLGYFKDDAATREARRFGWHHTGDLGYFDEDGQLVFADRMKDMIKSGGENIPSIVVEEAMLRHPDVTNCAAVGLPHPRWIEAVFVFVTLRPGAQCDPDALLLHARAHLSGFQVPKGLEIVETVPMTASGKIRKAELRLEYTGYFTD